MSSFRPSYIYWYADTDLYLTIHCDRLHSTLGILFILICIPFMLFRIFCIKTEFAKIIPGRRRLQGGLLGFTSRAWGALEMTPGLKRHQCEIEILGQNLGALPPNLSVEKNAFIGALYGLQCGLWFRYKLPNTNGSDLPPNTPFLCDIMTIWNIMKTGWR